MESRLNYKFNIIEIRAKAKSFEYHQSSSRLKNGKRGVRNTHEIAQCSMQIKVTLHIHVLQHCYPQKT